MVDTEIRLIILFATKDEEAYTVSKKKKRQELTLNQIMNSLLQNSKLNLRK